MPNEQLVAYIRAELAQQVDRETVIRALLTAGWQTEDINVAMMSVDTPVHQNIPTTPRIPAASFVQTAMTLQVQYPLSLRKFWKKILSQVLPLGILCALCAFLFSILSTLATANIFSGIGYFFFVEFILLFGASMLLYAWYVKAYIRRYYYDATDSYVTIKKGVFAPAEIHIQYSKIQDVYVDQDIIDRIMGLYDVHLATATVASGIEAHIDGVDQAAAEGLKNFLLQKLQSGGTASSSLNNAQPNASPFGAPSEPVTFASEISSRTYPITGTWFVQQMIIWLFTSLLYSIIFLRLLVLIDPSPSGLFFGDLAIFIVIYALHLFYMVLWRSAYSFNFLPDYIVTKQGVIAKKENHLPYRAVQDVTVSQGIIERMLGIATVRIENAAAAQVTGRNVVSSAVLIPGQPLTKANEISDVIKNVALTKNSSQTGL
jgi:putative membrane protein